MAGKGKPGPAKGAGGRPRKAVGQHKGNARDGYKRVTVGPAGAGTQAYEHRIKAGVTKRGPNVTVDHVNKNTSDNRGSNLEVVSRAENARRARVRKGK